MDDKVKQMASSYMTKAESIIPERSRFPVSFAPEEQTMAQLLGLYGAMVKNRGVEFDMDDNTISKVEKVTKWLLDSKKRGLLLCGTLGNGKTTMLRSLKYMFNSHAVYYEAQAIYDYFKVNQSLPQISMNDVLLIDDLGAEPNSYNDFGEKRYPLAEVLLARYRQNAPTVIATNCTLEQIGELYGDRVYDRIKEMFAMIKYIEPSYR